MDNYLEVLKVEAALQSEHLKMGFRKANKPNDINILDYTVIAALEKQIPKEVETETINRGISVTGEYDIEPNMLCPNCKNVVGNYESEELYFKYCPECGQRIENI